MFSKDGVLIGDVAKKASWIWSVDCRPSSTSSLFQFACGCEDGSLSLENVNVATVHGLHQVRQSNGSRGSACGNVLMDYGMVMREMYYVQDIYAYRDNLTDVVIQPLGSSHRVRIKCNECVKELAVYENIMAVHLKKWIAVYEKVKVEGSMTQYQTKSRVRSDEQCDQLVVTSQHLALCTGCKIRCLKFNGVQCVIFDPLMDFVGV
jgi:intraflagellar transport protein 122